MSEEFFHELMDSWQQGIRENGPPLEPMRKPRIQQQLVDLIYTMTCRVVSADALNAFFTGDNPVSFTYETGLLHPGGELTFPISSQEALHASWIPAQIGRCLLRAPISQPRKSTAAPPTRRNGFSFLPTRMLT